MLKWGFFNYSILLSIIQVLLFASRDKLLWISSHCGMKLFTSSLVSWNHSPPTFDDCFDIWKCFSILGAYLELKVWITVSVAGLPVFSSFRRLFTLRLVIPILYRVWLFSSEAIRYIIICHFFYIFF